MRSAIVLVVVVFGVSTVVGMGCLQPSGCGGRVKTPITVEKNCATCSGTGRISGTCAVCDGKGARAGIRCEACNGTGSSSINCNVCGGTGRMLAGGK